MSTTLEKSNSQNFRLTDDNYYESDANWRYWSVSQFKDFDECQAAALAKLKGDWKPESDPKALLVGNYVHSYFESPQAHEKFKKENQSALYKSPTVNQIKAELDRFGIPYGKSDKKDILLAKLNDEGKFLYGDLYADFEVAEQMIRALERQKKLMNFWNGEKESIVTGKMYGVEWKAKIDLLNVEKGYFIDLKTTADMYKRFWSNKYSRYVSFVEAYGYNLQMAMYEALLAQKYGKEFISNIFAVSKQDPPDVAWIIPNEHEEAFELDVLESKIEHFDKVKNGEEAPEACGKCEFCREHKIVEAYISPTELIS
jgi:hypothetical protein